MFRDAVLPSGAALIMVDEVTSENMILVIPGACENILAEEIYLAEERISRADVFVTQLETNLDAVEKAVDLAWEKGIKVILNPAPVQQISDDLLKKVYVLTPNEVEASVLSGIDVRTVEDAKLAAQVLRKRGVANVIITLGKNGSLLSTATQEIHVPPMIVDVVDTTGAGDAYNGGLATGISEGMDLLQAARFATVTSALSVTQMGTAPAMPYRDQIDLNI